MAEMRIEVAFTEAEWTKIKALSEVTKETPEEIVHDAVVMWMFPKVDGKLVPGWQ